MEATALFIYLFVFFGADGVPGFEFVPDMNITFVDQDRYELTGIRRINL
jgi:hypothetical protein